MSAANSSRHAEWHSFGWMLVLWNSEWRVDWEADMVADVGFLLAILRGRQAKLDAPGILDACEESGIEVYAIGDALKARGPLTDEIRADLKRCKDELLKLLVSVPAWDDAEAADLQRRLKAGHEAVSPHLHPTEDDVFSVAARNVLADALAAVARAIAVRRLDHLRRRADWLLGWMATLDERIHALRPDYSLNGQPPHLIHFVGKPSKAMENRQKKDEYARQLEKQRRFAEAAAVQTEPDDE